MVVAARMHKFTDTSVATEQVGKQLGQLTAPDTSKAMASARHGFGDERTWAIEDCRHLSARLERDLLLTAGSMRCGYRRTCPGLARMQGKSDPIDALAFGGAFLREANPGASREETGRRTFRSELLC